MGVNFACLVKKVLHCEYEKQFTKGKNFIIKIVFTNAMNVLKNYTINTALLFLCVSLLPQTQQHSFLSSKLRAVGLVSCFLLVLLCFVLFCFCIFRVQKLTTSSSNIIFMR